MNETDFVIVPRDEYDALRAAFERLELAKTIYQHETFGREYGKLPALEVILGLKEEM